MFGKKQKRIVELESELARITDLMAGKFDLALEKLGEFDPKVYEQGLIITAVKQANDQAKAQFDEMKAYYNK